MQHAVNIDGEQHYVPFKNRQLAESDVVIEGGEKYSRNPPPPSALRCIQSSHNQNRTTNYRCI